jgi:hypothetical protein
MSLTPSESDIRIAIDLGLGLLRESLIPFVERYLSRSQLKKQLDYYAEDLPLGIPDAEKLKRFDAHKLLATIEYLWQPHFGRNNRDLSRDDIRILADARNLFAHQQPISIEDATRWLQTMVRVLRQIGAAENANKTETILLTLTDHASLRRRWFSAPYKLTDGLEGLPGDQQHRVSQFLEYYLGTEEKPTVFGGRAEQLRILDDWLATPEPACALITGLAGRGKSALLAQWAQQLDRDAHRARLALVPISLRFNTADKSAALSILGGRLRALYSDRSDIPTDASLWNEEIRRYLTADRPADTPSLLVIIDGADETAGWELGYDLQLPSRLGRGVKLLVSARLLAKRDATGWLRQLGWEGQAYHIELPPLNLVGVREVLMSAESRLPKIENLDQFSKELTRVSGGDPLLVRLYLDALRARDGQMALLREEDLSPIPAGLDGYFDSWLKQQEKLWGVQAPLRSREVVTVLNLLACAKGPLDIEDLTELGWEDGLRSGVVRAALEPLGRFIVGNDADQGYTFAHPRLAQYFVERLTASERRRYAQRFVNYCVQLIHGLVSGEIQPQEVSAYALRSYCLHLQANKATPDQLDLLLSKAWLDAHEVQEGTFEGYLADLEIAWKVVVALGGEPEHQAWAVGWQCRYVLVRSSIQSLTSDFPADLLISLVTEDVWSPYQAMAYTRSMKDTASRVKALTHLTPYLPQNLRQEAVDYINDVCDPSIRCEAFALIATQVGTPERESLIEQAYQTYSLIDDVEEIVNCAVVLVPLLGKPEQQVIIDHAWEKVEEIDGFLNQFETVKSLFPALSRRQKRELLTAIGNFTPDSASRRSERVDFSGQEQFRKSPQAQALAMIAPHLIGTRHWEEAESLVRGISDARIRASLLEILSMHSTEDADALLMAAIEAARPFAEMHKRLIQVQRSREPKTEEEILQHWERVDDLRRRASKILTGQAGYTEDGGLSVFAFEFVIGDILRELAWLPSDDQAEWFNIALDLIARIEEPESAWEKLEAVISVAKQVNQPLWVLKGIEHLPIDWGYGDTPRADVLQKYIVWLAKSSSAHAASKLIDTLPKQDQVKLLTLLANALPPEQRPPVLREAQAAGRSIQDHFRRVHLLVELLARLPQDRCPPLACRLLRDINLFDTTDYVGDPLRATWLLRLFPYLGLEILDQVRSEIRNLYTEPDIDSRQAEHLKSISQFLSWEHIERELATKHRRRWNTTALPIFSARLVELGGTQSILNLIRRIDDTRTQTLLFLDLLKRVDEEDRCLICAQDFDFHGIFELFFNGAGEEILEEAIPFLPLSLMDNCVAAIREWSEDWCWFAARLAIIVLPHLPSEWQYQLLSDLLHWTAQADEGIRQSLMPRLSRQLTADLRDQVTYFIGGLRDEELRAEMKEWLLFDLLDQDSESAEAEQNDELITLQLIDSVVNADSDSDIDVLLLKISDMTDDEAAQARSLVAIAPQLLHSEHFAFTMNIISRLKDDTLRSKVLIALTPHLSVSYLPQALALARSMTCAAARCESLLALIGRQASEHRATIMAEVVRAALEESNNPRWSVLLKQLAPRLVQLNTEQAYEDWHLIAQQIARESRNEAQESLRVLAPVISSLGGTAAIETAARSVLDVRDWFL